MSLSNNYDWIVLGDHPGALLSANLAARLGLSVLVLPKSGSQKVQFSKKGQCLDPESNFISGIGEGELLSETLRKIGVVPGGSELNLEDGTVQVITPDCRFSVRRSIETVASELNRELALNSSERELIEHGVAHADDVRDYWKQLPSRLTFELNPKKKFPKEVPANWADLLRKLQKKNVSIQSDLLSALTYGFLGQLPEEWSGSDWSHALALGMGGASFRGGLSAYRRMLLRSAKNLGATVLEDAECRRIFVSNRRFAGIQISVSANMVSGVGCVVGSNLSEFADRMSITGSKWLRRSQKLPQPRGWRFTIAFTVRGDAIMPGASRRMVWKEAGAPVLEIEIADPSEYGTNEPDNKLIFLRTVLPFTQESLSPAYQRMTAARMFRLATEILPFLEYHVIRVYPDFSSAGEELSEVYGFAMPQLIPENLRVYEAGEKGVSTGIEGVFVVAGESFPKLGNLGPTVAAFESVAWLAHRSGLPGPLN